MVGAGTLMLLLAAWALWATLRRRCYASRLLLTLLVPAIALPYIANSTGWIFTEIGRAPWIVFGVMTLDAGGVSLAVTAGEVLFSLVGFTLLYGALMVADVYLLEKYARAGLAAPEPDDRAPAPSRRPRPEGGDTMDLNTLWFVLIGVLSPASSSSRASTSASASSCPSWARPTPSGAGSSTPSAPSGTATRCGS